MLQYQNRARPKNGFTLNLIQGLVGFCVEPVFLKSQPAPSTAWTRLLAVSAEPSVASSRSGTRS